LTLACEPPRVLVLVRLTVRLAGALEASGFGFLVNSLRPLRMQSADRTLGPLSASRGIRS
jgi:hypothetical protein